MKKAEGTIESQRREVRVHDGKIDKERRKKVWAIAR